MFVRTLTAKLLKAAKAGNVNAQIRVLRITRSLVLRTVADVAEKREVDAEHLAKVVYADLKIPTRVEKPSGWFEHGALCRCARRQGHPGAKRLIHLTVNKGCRWLLREGWVESMIRWLRSAGRAV